MVDSSDFGKAVALIEAREAATKSAQAQNAAHGLSLWEFSNNWKHIHSWRS
jgi:hypothetical protein